MWKKVYSNGKGLMGCRKLNTFSQFFKVEEKYEKGIESIFN